MTSPIRIASIDIGTNTVLMLVADVSDIGLTVVRDEHSIARLGEGVDKTGLISEEAFDRLGPILKRYLGIAGELRIQQLSAIATSAMRDAKNGQDIIQRVRETLGIPVETLSGADEARWTYRGAIAGMWSDDTTPIAVVDIGGGSTEISAGVGNTFERGVSIDIGAVRITERAFATSPITPEAAHDARQAIKAAIEMAAPERDRFRELIAVAGTPTTLAAMHQGLKSFDTAKVHGYVLHRAAIQQLLDIMLSVTPETLLDHFPAVNKARADILPAGTLILCEVMDFLGTDSIRVSTQGLRYGIALREWERLRQ